MPSAVSFAFWWPSMGVAPSAAPVPLALYGTATETLDDSLVTLTVGARSAPYPAGWLVELDEAPPLLELEIDLGTSVTTTGGWAAPMGVLIDFGVDLGAAYIGIGSSVLWMTNTGTTSATIASIWGGTVPRLLRIRYDQGGWSFWDEERLLATLPRAPLWPTLLRRPAVLIGCLNSGTGQVFLRSARLAVNAVLPSPDRLDQVRTAIRGAKETGAFRALLEAVAGVMEGPRYMLRALASAFTAATVSMLPRPVGWRGNVLPTAVAPPWTLYRSGQVSVVRERVRFAQDGGGGFTGAEWTWTGAAPHSEASWRLCATWVITDLVVDANGRLGPIMQVGNGSRMITAVLIELPGGQNSWTFSTSATTGAVVPLGASWQVYPNVSHKVEIATFGTDWAVLFVNEQPVELLSINEFSASGTRRATLGMTSLAGLPTGIADVSDVSLVVCQSDITRRKELEQVAIDRGLFASGCERPDLLERWLVARWAVLAGRGTTRGIIVDLRRLCCSPYPDIVVEEEPGGWVLEESWPDVTPVYVDDEGILTDSYVEFTATTPAWTPTAFARWLARYMVPVSRVDDGYYLTLVCIVTGVSTLVAGYRRLPVDRSAYFEAGDAVILRSADNTTREVTEVYQIVDDTTIDVVDTGDLAVAGWRLCKVLGRS